MPKKVAVEEGLTGVRDLLQKNGYEVISPGSGEEVLAVVGTGLDNNVMNMQDLTTRSVVIDATGKTPAEILSRVRELG
ncbi:MAG: YkuS family protein [Thermoanaerobacteraceae bacterium]|nr:YkuS family protein [Thermoanaerobacteraceae bacterium]